eukprot:9480628-Pyramimonas_sp.AAC.1
MLRDNFWNRPELLQNFSASLSSAPLGAAPAFSSPPCTRTSIVMAEWTIINGVLSTVTAWLWKYGAHPILWLERVCCCLARLLVQEPGGTGMTEEQEKQRKRDF